MSKGKEGFYYKYYKRKIDFILSLVALILTSPLFLIFTIIGIFAMKGNPFFIQPRAGLNEKKFNLIKFRTMSNERDEKGELLPDEQRLNVYGKFLRKTSIDELPELINILKGDMSFAGPRPLAVEYLPYYTDKERIRHTVIPGLTGLAQVHGRNSISWEERFAYDIKYAENVSFLLDVEIMWLTVCCVLKCSDIGLRGVDAPMDFDVYRMEQEKRGHVIVKDND